MLRHVGVYLRFVPYPSDGKLLDEGMPVPVSPITRQQSERKEGVSSGERAPILDSVPFDCVGNMFFWMACYILEIPAGARANIGNAE